MSFVLRPSSFVLRPSSVDELANSRPSSRTPTPYLTAPEAALRSPRATSRIIVLRSRCASRAALHTRPNWPAKQGGSAAAASSRRNPIPQTADAPRHAPAAQCCHRDRPPAGRLPAEHAQMGQRGKGRERRARSPTLAPRFIKLDASSISIDPHFAYNKKPILHEKDGQNPAYHLRWRIVRPLS